MSIMDSKLEYEAALKLSAIMISASLFIVMAETGISPAVVVAEWSGLFVALLTMTTIEVVKE